MMSVLAPTVDGMDEIMAAIKKVRGWIAPGRDAAEAEYAASATVAKEPRTE